jgi:hypothetical protein
VNVIRIRWYWLIERWQLRVDEQVVVAGMWLIDPGWYYGHAADAELDVDGIRNGGAIFRRYEICAGAGNRFGSRQS